MTISWTRLLSSLSLPITMTILVPAGILWTSSGTDRVLPPSQMLWVLGSLLILLGLIILVLTVKDFVFIGKGTLAPWDPPRQLVVTGMYRYVRNPMISGVMMIIAGEVFLFDSRGIFYWLIFFFIFNTLYFIFKEEPGLIRRFGKDYSEYKANVPRWIPRPSPWEPNRP